MKKNGSYYLRKILNYHNSTYRKNRKRETDNQICKYPGKTGTDPGVLPDKGESDFNKFQDQTIGDFIKLIGQSLFGVTTFSITIPSIARGLSEFCETINVNILLF